MIDELLSIIKTELEQKNTYLNKVSINCFQLDSGEVVADFNRQEAYEGATDTWGVGAYIRYTTKIEYSPLSGNSSGRKPTTSNSNQNSVTVPLRVVVYNFDDSKEFNLVRLEEKISNDIQGVDFSAHVGQETQLSIELVDANFNAQDNWKTEMGRPIEEGNNFFQMVSININLKFVRTFMKADCFDDCYVFNNDKKC